MSDYERERAANIARNKARLLEMGLDNFIPGPPPAKPGPATKKRKAKSDLPNVSPAKVPRTISKEESTLGTRRSQRILGKTVDYTAEQYRGVPAPARITSRLKGETSDGPLGRESGKRIHDPKTYGSIPGIAVGTWWETREGCSIDAIHAPWVAGISSGRKGAYSIALSGGYDDDVDEGYGFTYTGSGGRDLKGTKDAPKNLRTAPQSCDQTFDNNFNAALKRSSETKQPVRVIRGYKLDSRFAPDQGYRYDGLYTVEKAWIEKGLNPKGYLVCKFVFKRMSGQPALPDREADTTQDEAQGENDEASEEQSDTKANNGREQDRDSDTGDD